jgi:predicted AlkP superfamily pyrophosphatase or phosphodiesterase
MMKPQETLRAIALMLVAFSTPTFAAGPGASNDFGGKRVLIIGIDGLRADALALANTPNLDALAAQGVLTYQAYAGGDLGTVTEQPTWSGPGWTSITTGVWTNKHKVVGNTFAGYKKNVATNYPHFFKRLKDLKPNAYVSSIVDWAPIDSQIVDKVASSVNYRVIGTGSTYALQDADVKNKAVAHLASANPDVAFVYFVNVDETGHSSGFSPTNPAYISAIETTDAHIGAVLAAINARPQIAQEKWLYVVACDHGGTGTGHGGQ